MYFATPTVSAVLQKLQDVPAGRFPVLLIGEEDPLDCRALCEAARDVGLDFIGGIFPRVIHGEETSTRGAVLLHLPSAGHPVLVKGLDDIADPEGLMNSVGEIGEETKSILVLIDGLTPNIGEFLAALYGRAGANLSYFGGGAGSLSLQQQPAILTPEGVFQDAAVILPVAAETHLGVHHGWQRLAGPFVASRTDKNLIVELNWQPAFEVYQATVEPVIGRALNRENFFDHAKGFPFGMSREGGEDIVRDPIAVDENGCLVCVGEVSQHSVLHILRGEPTDLIEAATQAGADCPIAQPDGFLLVDCISRILYLGDRFHEELAAVRKGNGLADHTPLAGALTLGEISSVGGYLEFLNKTIVFAAYGCE